MKIDYWFSFDELKILGGYKDKVHVLGQKDEYDETKEPKLEVGVSYLGSDFPDHFPEDCILSIDRKLFKKMLDKWLDEKLDYCDQWNHYCGVGGNIYCEKVTKAYDTIIYDYISNENDKIEKNIVVYNVNSFNRLIDMEHG
jgi:hypothetical protein